MAFLTGMRSRVLALLLAATAVPATALVVRAAYAADAQYTTHGVVKSFGKDRKYVNIRHDDIPGYMMSMTMSFQPRSPSQLDGLAEGDKVKLTFTDAGDKRWLDSIAKE